MKIFIPKLGTKLTLSKAWAFNLHDERRNEAFWLAVHGKPAREQYYYGYHNGYHTSPVKTATAKDLGHKPAKPMKTTLPKGTVLTIERIYIRNGASDFDSITFRITKGGTVPAGRFWVKTEDINNKLDAESEIIEKYPHGKFYLNIIEGTPWQCESCRKSPAPASHVGCRSPHYCDCSSPAHHHFKNYVLGWISKPGASFGGGRKATVVHETNVVGKDELKIETGRTYNSTDGYSKYFTTLDDCLKWATKKNFTKAHIEMFIAKYEEKKAQAETDKLC